MEGIWIGARWGKSKNRKVAIIFSHARSIYWTKHVLEDST